MVRCKVEGREDDSWWTLWPELFNAELEAFLKKGITPRTVYKRNGILILETDWPMDGQPESMHLRIGFSPFHPFFRPAVSAPDERFERHQNPLSRELCLLTQETGQWNSRQLVADFVQERLEQVLKTLCARREARWQDAAELEEHAPDPLMPYFADLGEDDSVILFDGTMPVPSGGHGLMEVAYTIRHSNRNSAAFEGVLRQLNNSDGVMIGKRFAFPNEPSTQILTGRWVKFAPPPVADPAELLQLAEKELEKQAVLQAPSVQKVNHAFQSVAGQVSITGIVFPDEAEYGHHKKGAGWLFLATRRPLLGSKAGIATTRMVRGERAGKDDTFSRLPIASALLRKKVLVVGCGAIGSFAGLELARAGVGELGLLDYETVQPGNSLRWPIGRPAWGVPKPLALANFIAANYPWTKTTAYGYRMGGAFSDPATLSDSNEHALTLILDVLREVDLVIDTSASFEVQYALSHYCGEFKVPYIMGYATVGLTGGVVARFLPGAQSCLICLHEHWNDGTIPKPHEDPAGIVIPVGCNAPTFTGGGFDLQEVSLEVVRSAVGLLSEGEYDAGAWPLAILTLKNADGRRVLPYWEACQCTPHARCCGAQQ